VAGGKFDNAIHCKECGLAHNTKEHVIHAETICAYCKSGFHQCCMQSFGAKFVCNRRLLSQSDQLKLNIRTRSLLCCHLTFTKIMFSLSHILLISVIVWVGGQLNNPPIIFFIYSTSTAITAAAQ